MSANPNSVAGQGQFHDSIPPAKPRTYKGVTGSGTYSVTHQLGQQDGNEAIPEFRAETCPPGTAPKEHSHRPNTGSEIPGQAFNPDMDPSMRAGGLDMPGATSKDAYNESTFS